MKSNISFGPPPGLDLDFHKIADKVESPSIPEIPNIIGLKNNEIYMNRKL